MGENNKWPCVRYTVDEYANICKNLLKWGYNLYQIRNLSKNPYLATYMNERNDVSNICGFSDAEYYECPNVDTFLHDCKEIAIREGWYKGESEPVTPTIDWEQRRYDVAKELLLRMKNPTDPYEVSEVIKTASEFIEQMICYEKQQSKRG